VDPGELPFREISARSYLIRPAGPVTGINSIFYKKTVASFFHHTLTMAISNGTTAPTAGTSKCLPTHTPGECFWQTARDDLSDHRSTEQLPEHSDIVIIGAGYAGVSAAYHLVKDGDASKSIAILEARGTCSGATGRNGGHCRPDFYGHIPTYMDRAGDRAGAEIAEFEIANLRALKKIIEQEKIDCDFTLARSVDVWCNEESAKKAKVVYDRMVAADFEYMKDAVFYTGQQVEGVCGFVIAQLKIN
jgi:hypothetical protein